MVQTFEVVVPPNAVGGQAISVSAPTGLLQVVVPSHLRAGDKFLISAPPPPCAVPVAVPMGMLVGSQQASILAKLGPIGSHFSFEIQLAKVPRYTRTTIEGSMPVTSAGRTVATLWFQSSQKGQHLSASLVLPSGEVVATFERGTAPKTTLFTVAGPARTGPAPPVAIGVQGNPYGFLRTRVYERWMGGILEGTDFGYVGSDMLVASTAPQPMGNYFSKLDNHGGYTFTSSKKSQLGKKEAPLPVTFFGGGANGVIHVVPEKKYAYFGAREVLCEPGDKQDVLLMGAAMAAIVATEKVYQVQGSA